MFAPEGNTAKIIALCAITSILTNFLEGYCSAYPNTSQDAFEEFLNQSYANRNRDGGLSDWGFTWFWSLFLNIWFIGFLLGTLMTPLFADNYGRKVAILLANSINLGATITSVLSIMFHLPEMLIIGRILGAVGSGISMNAIILFIQETTPTALRGTCSFLSEGTFIAANVIGMGMGMDVVLGNYLIPLIGLAIIPGVMGILIVIPLKESPKYLLINRNDRKAALDALIYYQGKEVNHNDILEEILKESDNSKVDLPFFLAIKEVIEQPYLRKAMTIGVLSLQIIVGIWPIIYNSTELLEAHMSAKTAQFSSFLFISANFLASIVGMWAVERFGRRPMLLYCGIGNTISLCAYILFDRLANMAEESKLKYGCVAALIGYGITYGCAVGPIAAFITSELCPQRFRSLVQSLVYCINTVIIFGLSFVTLPLYRLFDVWSFIPLFIVPSTLSLIYLCFQLPETKGREIHEIVEQLMRDTESVADILPDILPKNYSSLSKFKESLRKMSSKLSNAKSPYDNMNVPKIIIKSASNHTLNENFDAPKTKIKSSVAKAL
ncbi:sugar transporter domain-containing protein [Ditylenchus destructor]|nr:sugar transporter domain-containing protein [Ditylenchus destructor]